MTEAIRGRTRRSPARRSHPIDRRVALRIRERRQSLGHSQAWLASEIGVTYQQVQKYESGRNRITAGRLHLIAGVLGVPVAHFFEDADESRSEAG